MGTDRRGETPDGGRPVTRDRRLEDVQGRLPSRRVVVLGLVASGLGLAYALYRGYYALGGTAGMFGVPESQAQEVSRALTATPTWTPPSPYGEALPTPTRDVTTQPRTPASSS